MAQNHPVGDEGMKGMLRVGGLHMEACRVIPRTLTATVVLSALTLLSIGCRQRPYNRDKYEATSEYPAASPSGKFRLVVTKGFNGNEHFAQFQIMTNERIPRVLFCSKEQFRTFDTTYFLWDSRERVWVYSGDVGAFYWVRMSDDAWKKNTYYQGDPGLPKLLMQRRPHLGMDRDGRIPLDTAGEG
jgi:hypothetical protein